MGLNVYLFIKEKWFCASIQKVRMLIKVVIYVENLYV